MQSRQARGDNAERLARAHLESAGLRFEQANFRCRFGEVDLIMRDQTTVVFVEVRSRTSARHQHPLHSIDSHKQRRLFRTAQFYLQTSAWRYHRAEPLCRFDVVTLLMLEDQPPELVWIEAAFDGDY